MRNLFLRFFLSFWVATVLVLIITVLTTLWLANERFSRDLDRQNEFARQASQVLASDGVPGLRAWIRDQQQAVFPERLYLLDHRGRDILGRPVPEFLQALIGQRPFPRPGGRGRDEPEMRLLSQLVSPSNETFALSLQRRRGGPFGIFASPETPAVAAIMTLLVGTVVCFLLARFLSAPINELRRATHRIAAGDLAVSVSGPLRGRRDELAMLATDFDAMAARLRLLLESRQQLLRDVSHELRSPLARVEIALGLARRPGADLAQELGRIEREVERLDELIGEILALCRLDDPARQLDSEPVALEELLDGVCDNARMEAEPGNVRIDLRVTPGLIVQGDRELLHRAIENVVRNAIRFSPAGGLISVVAAASDGRLRLQIADQGPGVPAELLGRIFEPFYRVSSARDRDSGGGSGVGLAITSRVLGLHGGTASARNRDSGGLLVELSLPLGVQPAV
ncbi:MAG: HAMP domain-containing protein [Gammaproteobacteria bacterium]|nr:HAMP domain-containing protein [Gammaproteobacteria bacterium]